MKVQSKVRIICNSNNKKKKSLPRRRIVIIKATPLELQKSLDDVCDYSEEVKKRNLDLSRYKHRFLV